MNAEEASVHQLDCVQRNQTFVFYFPRPSSGVQIKFLFLQDGMFISVTVDGEFPSTRVPKQGFYGHWSRAVTTRRRKIVAASGMLCLSHAEAAVLAGGPQSAV